MNMGSKVRAGIASAALAAVVVGGVAVAAHITDDDRPVLEQTTVGAADEGTVESTTTAAPSTTVDVEAPETTVAAVETTTTTGGAAAVPTHAPSKQAMTGGELGDEPTDEVTTTVAPEPDDVCPEVVHGGSMSCSVPRNPDGSPPPPYRECWDGTLRQECPPISPQGEEPAAS